MPENVRPMTPAEILALEATKEATALRESEVFAYALALFPLAFAGVDLTEGPAVRAASRKAFDAAKVIARWRENK